MLVCVCVCGGGGGAAGGAPPPPPQRRPPDNSPTLVGPFSHNFVYEKNSQARVGGPRVSQFLYSEPLYKQWNDLHAITQHPSSVKNLLFQQSTLVDKEGVMVTLYFNNT